MPVSHQSDSTSLQSRLDACLEVEYSFRDTEGLSQQLRAMSSEDQDFVLGWTERVSSTNVELAFQFALHAAEALARMDSHTIEAWVLHAMDCYDRSGLRPALGVIADMDKFLRQGLERSKGCLLEEISGVLLPFIQGLSGRKLRLEATEGEFYTDGEVIYLPAVNALFADEQANFALYKAQTVHLWAQVRFGTFSVDLCERLQGFADFARALQLFHALEIHRLDACIRRELPGVHRQMQWLKRERSEGDAPAGWDQAIRILCSPQAGVEDALRLTGLLDPGQLPQPICYQGALKPDLVEDKKRQRLVREKAALRVVLAEMSRDLDTGRPEKESRARFEVTPLTDHPDYSGLSLEVRLDGKPLSVPDHVYDLMSSIMLDLGAIPPEYLMPAGPGEYDLKRVEDRGRDPDDVWKGVYHEEGAFLYKEWDYNRRHYRKDWCVLREIDVEPESTQFYERTLVKHAGLRKSLQRTFEALRGEDKLLKRQSFGDEVDIDALVEARADSRQGFEMTDRLFTRLNDSERNIAVIIMVDMSGSTKGWVNDAERESLVLLAESLETLRDRYAVYGFSGINRKRCEVFRVKRFEERLDDQVRGRIGAIAPRDYTRMGAAIRHLGTILENVDAAVRILVTLSDGKPEDYDGYYRGEYGVEDTRQALFEVRQKGIHPFCITIDDQAGDYLPHMYGAANYVVVKDVDSLPLKISDIYRKLTT